MSRECSFGSFLSQREKRCIIIKVVGNDNYHRLLYVFFYSHNRIHEMAKLQLQRFHGQEIMGQSNLISISQRGQSML